MERRIGSTPFGDIKSLSASAKGKLGTIDVRDARTLTLTCKAKTDSSATSGVRINLYFSPDGDNFDTIPYATYDVNLNAGNSTQETKIIDPPEHGFIEVEVENLDSTYAATMIFVWITIKKWCN